MGNSRSPLKGKGIEPTHNMPTQGSAADAELQPARAHPH